MIRRLVNAYNKYHKRTWFTMALFVMLFTITLLCVNMLINSSNKDSMETLLDQYGSYHYLVHGISQEDLDIILEHERLTQYGIITHSGNYSINETDYYVSIGSYDESALELGRISLTEGSFPLSQDEICLEERYRYVFDKILNIGDLIKLDIDEEQIVFKISGFIKDYSGYWNNLDEIVIGENDYPNVLVAQQVAQKYKTAESIMLYYSGVMDYKEFSNIQKIIGIYDTDRIVSNDEVYSSGFMILQEPIKRYTFIFSGLYLLLGTYILYMIQRMHLLSLLQEKDVLYGIGTSRKDFFVLNCSITVWPFFIGLITGTAFYVLFFMLFEKGIYFGYVFSNIIYIYLVIIAYVLSFITVYLLKSIERGSEKQTKQYKFTSNYIIELYSVFTKRKVKRVLALIILIGVILSLFQCIDYDRQYGQFLNYEGKYYFINANSSRGYRSIYVAGMSLNSTSSSYGFSDIVKVKEALSSYDGVYFNYVISGDKCIEIPETDSEYWNTLKNRSSYLAFVGTPNCIEQKEVDSVPDDISFTDYFGTFTVKDNNIDVFRSLYPEIDIETDLAPGKIVIFCEPVSIGTIELTEDYLKDGDTIKLASVDYTGTYSEALSDHDTIQFYEEEYVISKVVREYFDYKDEYTQTGGYGMPIIVWTEETASMNRNLNKIESLSCHIDKTVSDDDYDNIRNIFNRIALSSRNALIAESRFAEDFYKKFYTAIDVSSIVVLILVILSVGYALYSLIYIDMREDRLNTAILRTIGMNRHSYYQIKIMEYVTYVLIGFLLSMILCFASLKLFSNSFYPIQMPVLLQYTIVIIGVVFTALILVLALAFVSVNSMFKKDIADTIRNKE